MSIIKNEEVSFGEEDLLAPNVGAMVDRIVSENPGKDAFSCVLPTGHSATIQFEDVKYLSDAVAAYLRNETDLQPGDVVAVQSPNTLAYPVLAFGILKAGFTITNINPLYTVDETNHQLKDSKAKAMFIIDVFGHQTAEAIEGTDVKNVYKLSLTDLFPTMTRKLLGFAMKYVKKVVPAMSVPVTADFMTVVKKGKAHLATGIDVSDYYSATNFENVAFYQYTGGTTGRSKGAELTHYNIVANISQSKLSNGAAMAEEEHRLLLILPLYHVYALAVGCIATMNAGSHVVLVPVPRPLENIRHAFEKFDITIMPGVNTLFHGLLQQDWFRNNPPKNLQMCFSGAAPLMPATAKEWEDLTQSRIYEGYGLTEGTCIVTSMPFHEDPKPGTCGRPIPGTELRIVDSEGNDMPRGEKGELWIRGPQIMKGYLNRPEATAETITDDGWLRTGDVAIVDEEGYLSIVDRIKDMVIVSGFNVYPADVEDVLTTHEGIGEAAVVGVPDAETGERVVAFVVLADTSLNEDEIRAYCKEHLTGYKVPKTICIIDALPKSPVGKVLRRELRDQAVAELGLSGQ